jgi:LmbE family N-acetylglucosaminyl deacetylase
MVTRATIVQLLELLRNLPDGAPSPVLHGLLLGRAPAEIQAELSRLAERVASAPNLDHLPDGTPIFDLVVAIDALENQRWDRWTLQRIHGLLRPGGWLLLAVPNLLDLWSLRGWRFLAGRSFREARLRAGARFGRSIATPRFSGRRYRPAGLRALLSDLGFECVIWRGVGGRLHRALSAMAPGVETATAAAHVVAARRAPSLWSDPDRPYPDPAAHLERFESDHAPLIRMRNRWAERHAGLAGPPAQPFDPSRYRGKPALVLAPHPDDEVIGCGGTLLRMVAAGARVALLHATDGSDSAALQDAEEGVRTTVRLQEADRVGRALGAHEIVTWKADNRRFLPEPRWIEALTALLVRIAPAAIFVPFPLDVHPDHWTLTRILADALPRSGLDLGAVEVLSYEVWSLVPANLASEVTPLMPTIERLLLLYVTALMVDDYVHLGAARLHYNARRYLGAPGYAEAFLATNASRYLHIVREQERDPMRPQSA